LVSHFEVHSLNYLDVDDTAAANATLVAVVVATMLSLWLAGVAFALAPSMLWLPLSIVFPLRKKTNDDKANKGGGTH